jgi:hypothetical protein
MRRSDVSQLFKKTPQKAALHQPRHRQQRPPAGHDRSGLTPSTQEETKERQMATTTIRLTDQPDGSVAVEIDYDCKPGDIVDMTPSRLMARLTLGYLADCAERGVIPHAQSEYVTHHQHPLH